MRHVSDQWVQIGWEKEEEGEEGEKKQRKGRETEKRRKDENSKCKVNHQNQLSFLDVHFMNVSK